MTLPWMAAKILLRPVAVLRPHAGNARVHSAEQLEQIKASMLAFGFTNPLLADEDGVLIAGHGRLEAASALGIEKVPVIVLRHLSAAQKEALRLADNRIPYAENARTHSPAQVAQIAASIAEFGFVNPVLVDAEGVLIAGHGRVMAAKQLGLGSVPVLRLGHLSPAQARALRLADNQIALNSGWDQALLAAEIARIRDEAVVDLDVLGFSGMELDRLLAAADAALGRADYHQQFEAMLYGWKAGAQHYWCGARDQGNVWHFDKPARNDLHPTMKPVALVERAIRNSSKPRETVLDCFGGSGTTMIAAERTGRRAVLLEIDPAYADVIVRRWQDTTGEAAVLEDDDRTFADVATTRGEKAMPSLGLGSA